MEALKPKFLKEMKKTGMKKQEIGTFVIVGVSLWAVLLWMFVRRYQKMEDTTTGGDNLDYIKQINIVIIAFHILTFVPFTVLESNYLNTNVWISWMTIALAVITTFFNGVIVAYTLSQSTAYDDVNYPIDITSLGLQCLANSLMMAYIFRLIRSKGKMIF